MPKTVWSYGGGKQTAAIAALIIQGVLPVPDLVVMADTGRERSSTWRYLRMVTRPALREIGLDVWVVQKAKYATVDMFDAKGMVLLPAFTTLEGGTIGRTRAYCSNEWKKRVVQRWLTDNKFRPVQNWLGISTDEADRMKDSDVGWLSHYYPLCDLGISRNQCVEIVARMGWPPAPKSTCWMCPNMSDATWREIQRDDPEDFAQAVSTERLAREKDPHVYFHRSGVTLDQVEFGGPMFEGFEGCDSGHCWT